MQGNHDQQHSTDLVHGHSRLIWLVDEVNAHLEGLGESETSEVGPIADELERYWGELCAELSQHLRTEEAEIFVAVIAGAPELRDDIAMLQEQHRDLADRIDSLDHAVRALLGRDVDPTELATVRREVAAFREHVSSHSRAEREVLGRASERGVQVDH